jgi:DNA-binding NarL/FixJ family response regulator
MATRILIADDHDIVRQGLRQILSTQPDLEVWGEAADSASALEQALHAECDALVLDLAMPGRGGLEVLAELRRQRPTMPVLVMSMYGENEFAVRVLRAGAAGYIAKGASADELVRAIRTVASGRRYLSARVAEELASHLLAPSSASPHSQLSDREFQVFVRLARGNSATEVAGDLSLSVKTVSTYRTRVLEKLALRTNADLVRYAIEHRLA